MRRKAKKIANNSTMRTSMNLRPVVIEALGLIKHEKGVDKSRQIEFGLQKYFEEHRPLLEEAGLDVWVR